MPHLMSEPSSPKNHVPSKVPSAPDMPINHQISLRSRLAFYTNEFPKAHLSRLRKGFKAFRRPISTMLRLNLSPPPWSVTFVDGTCGQYLDRDSVFQAARGVLFSTLLTEWVCRETGIRITLHGCDYEILSNNEYSWLPVGDRTVVDVGANVGDSTLYFAARGAAKVYAFEPFPGVYKLALENLKLNAEVTSKSKIVLVNQGVGRPRVIRLATDANGTLGTPATEEAKSGRLVPITSLEAILQSYAIENPVLKMDCEGCEYEALLDATRATVRQFSHIQLEYHYWPDLLVQCLEQFGFEVRYTRPRYSFNRDAADNPRMMAGQIYAVRR